MSNTGTSVAGEPVWTLTDDGSEADETQHLTMEHSQTEITEQQMRPLERSHISPGSSILSRYREQPCPETFLQSSLRQRHERTMMRTPM